MMAWLKKLKFAWCGDECILFHKWNYNQGRWAKRVCDKCGREEWMEGYSG